MGHDPCYDRGGVRLYVGDCQDVLRGIEAGSVQCCVTSPPYWGLRDYGAEGQLGLEPTPEEYVERMVGVFREVRRVLADDGTLWLNLGDSYTANGKSGDTRSGFNERYFGSGNPGKQAETAAHLPTRIIPHGLKPKDLVGIPWRVAFALQADGWYLRSDIIWSKPNPMPESVTDRPTKAHEYVFLLSKSQRYYFDADAVKESASDPGRPPQTSYGRASEAHTGNQADQHADPDRIWNAAPGRNIRSVWPIATSPFPGAHFAVMPPKLVEPCIKAGCPTGGTVLDPFSGAGTVPYVARDLGCRAVGIELNATYCEIAAQRLAQEVLPFG